MEPKDAVKKLFHAVVVVGMSLSTEACSSDSTPAPTPSDSGVTNDSGHQNSDAAPSEGGSSVDAGDTDAFTGWAPCA